MKQAITWVIATAALAITSTAGAASVGSDDHPVIKTEHVHAADLDLARSADVVTLYGRLKRAAVRVCVVPTGSIFELVDEACRRRALADAVAQVDNAALTSLHAHRGVVRQLAANDR
jgi:UrcA family protein